MISTNDLLNIKQELLKLFPETESIKSENTDFATFYLYFDKSRKLALKFSRDYLQQNSLDDFSKHLQRNIYYVMKSNINKSVHLMKNFGIEIEELSVGWKRALSGLKKELSAG